jgi:hypothetical protein
VAVAAPVPVPVPVPVLLVPVFPVLPPVGEVPGKVVLFCDMLCFSFEFAIENL